MTKFEVHNAKAGKLISCKAEVKATLVAQSMMKILQCHHWVVRVVESIQWDSRKAYPNGIPADGS